MKPPFKVIIAGSRSFDDLDLMKEKCDSILQGKVATHDIHIISGTARGADRTGELYAKARGYKIMYFPADWSLGKQAGLIRNAQMLEHADAVVVFWDGSSNGSKHMISITKDKGMPLRVIRF